jgi:hypothetical protein
MSWCVSVTEDIDWEEMLSVRVEHEIFRDALERLATDERGTPWCRSQAQAVLDTVLARHKGGQDEPDDS